MLQERGFSQNTQTYRFYITCTKNLAKKTSEHKELYDVKKDILIFKNQKVKSYHATGTRCIARKPKALKKYVGKFGLFIYHMENILADTSNRPFKDRQSHS